MSTSTEYDVIIVGCGPVGAFCGALMSRYGIKTLILEKDSQPFSAPRAVAFDDETVRLMGLHSSELCEWVADHCLKCPVDLRSGPPTDASSYSVIGPLTPHVVENTGHYDTMFFNQPAFECKLREIIKSAPNCTLLLGTAVIKLDFDSKQRKNIIHAITSDGQSRKYSSRWLLACDGGASATRKAKGIAFEGSTFPAQPWLVADVKTSDPDILHTWQCFNFICDPLRPAVHVPLPGGARRFEFMLHPGETTAQPSLSDLLRNIGVDLRKLQVLRKVVYTFHDREAAAWHVDRVALAGDSAHCMPPFRGQGLCAGLRDAASLCWRIAACCQLGNEAAMCGYQAERQQHLRSVAAVAVWMGRLITVRWKVLAAVRNVVFAALYRCPLIKPVFKEPFAPPTRVDAGLFDFTSGKRVVGEHIPNYMLLKDGKPMRMDAFLHLLAPNSLQWYVICAPHVATPSNALESPLLAGCKKKVAVQVVQLLPPCGAEARTHRHQTRRKSAERGSDDDEWWFTAEASIADAASLYHSWFTEKARCDVVIVRPDLFVYGAYSLSDVGNAWLQMDNKLRSYIIPQPAKRSRIQLPNLNSLLKIGVVLVAAVAILVLWVWC